jgi:protein-tyrosine phosphatase
MTFHKVLLLAVTILSGAVIARAEVTNLSCEQTGPADYKLTYAFTADSHEVRISATTDASGQTGLQEILKTAESPVTVHAGAPGQRIYFFLKPDHGHTREVSIRHLPLEGTPNFRDLGGYETSDGKFVRWGLLYRSGVLSHLTEQDFAYLTPLGVKVVCDFRTAQENATNPEIWIPAAHVEHVSLPIGSDSGSSSTKGNGPSMEEFLKTNPSATDLKAWMTKIYGGFALTNAPEYSKVFAELKQDRLPLLYHCAAGKDRTGVFSALLLLALGVPEQTVLADYELTDKYLRDAMSAEAARKMMASSSTPGMSQLSAEQRNVMMAADPEYLKSTLRRIDEQFGSFDNYRRTALQVSDADVAQLRARLLTD